MNDHSISMNPNYNTPNYTGYIPAPEQTEVDDIEVPFSPIPKVSPNTLLLQVGENDLHEAEKWLFIDTKHEGAKLIDDKLFAHIHGDSFIGGMEELEGHDSTITIQHMLEFLSSINEPSKEIQLVMRELGQALLIKQENKKFFTLAPEESSQKKPKGSHNDDLSPTDHQIKICKRAMALAVECVSLLQNGKTFTLPFGFKNQRGAHAMLLQFENLNGKIRLRVFNTGEGLEYHTSHPEHGKIKYNPIYLQEEIPFEQEKLNLFFKGMLECNYPDNEKPLPPDKQPDADYIYQKLLPSLGGQVKSDTSEFQDFISGQTAGICAEKSLHAFLRSHMVHMPSLGKSSEVKESGSKKEINSPQKKLDIKEYKKFECDYKEQTLKIYLKKFLLNLNPSKTQIMLVQKSLAGQLSRLKKLYGEGILTPQEFHQGLARHAVMQNAFAEKMQKIKDLSPPKKTNIELPPENPHFVNTDLSHVVPPTLVPKLPSSSQFLEPPTNLNPSVIKKSIPESKTKKSTLESKSDVPQKKTSFFSNLFPSITKKSAPESKPGVQKKEVSSKDKKPQIGQISTSKPLPNVTLEQEKPIITPPDIGLSPEEMLTGVTKALKDMQVLTDQITPENRRSIQRQQILYFHHLINALGIPNLDVPRWGKLSKEQAEELMRTLNVISSMAFKAEVDFYGKPPFDRKVYLAHGKTTAIACHLARIQCPELLEKQGFAIQHLNQYLNSPFAVSLNPVEQREWEQIIDILCPPSTRRNEVIDFSPRWNLLQHVTDKEMLHPTPDILFILKIISKKTSVTEKDVQKAMTEFIGSSTTPSWFSPFINQQAQLVLLFCNNQEKNKHFIDHNYSSSTSPIQTIQINGLENHFEQLSLPSASNAEAWVKTAFSVIYPGLGKPSIILERGKSFTFNKLLLTLWEYKLNKNAIMVDFARVLNSRGFQVLEAIQFFNRYPHLVAEPAFQAALKMLLFQPKALKNYLAIDPHFVSVLETFVNKGIETSQKKGDRRQELFFLEMSAGLHAHLKEIPELESGEFAKSLKGFEEKFNACIYSCHETLMDPKFSPEIKEQAAFLYLNLAQLPQFKIDKDSVPLLLAARSILEHYPESPGIANRQEVDLLWNKLMPDILKVLELNIKRFPDAIACQAIISTVNPNFENLKELLKTEFKFDFKQQAFENKNCKVDLKTGQIYFNQLPYETHYEKIKNDPAFKQVFASVPHTIVPVQPGMCKVVYQTEGKQKTAIVEYKLNAGVVNCSIIKDIDSLQCKLIPQPSKELLSLIPSHNQENTQFWKIEGQPLIFCINSQDERSLLIILDKKSQVSEVIAKELSPALKDKGDLFLDLKRMPLGINPWWAKNLTDFEDPCWIELWCTGENNKSTEMTEGSIIRLPRYGLDFEVKKSKDGLCLCCVQDPGYYLEPTKVLGENRPCRQVLVLKHQETGEKKALFPFRDMRTSLPEKFEKIPLQTIAIGKKGKLAARTCEEHLFLAHLALRNSKDSLQVQEAEKQLLAAWSVQKPSEKSQAMLLQILQQLQSRQESTLIGLCLKLLCQCEAWRHEQPQGTKDALMPFLGLTPDEVQSLFGTYLQKHKKNILTDLSPEEKSIIIKFLPVETSDPIKRQFNSLQRIEPSQVLTGKQITVTQRNPIIKSPFKHAFFKDEEAQWILPKDIETLPSIYISEKAFFYSFKALLEQAVYGSPKERDKVFQRVQMWQIEGESEEAMTLRDILLDACKKPTAYSDLLLWMPKIPAFKKKYCPKINSIKSFFKPQKPMKVLVEESSPSTPSLEFSKPESPSKTKGQEIVDFHPTSLKPTDLLKHIIPVSELTSNTQKPKTPELTISSKDPQEDLWLKDTRTDFEDRDKQVKSKLTVENQSIPDIKEQLTTNQGLFQKNVKDKRTEILELINKPPIEKNTDKVIQSIVDTVVRHKRPAQTIDQLLLTYLKGTPASWLELNPFLSKEECGKLDQLISEYLQEAAFVQKTKRELKLVKKIEKEKDLGVLEDLKESLAQSLLTERDYLKMDLTPQQKRFCAAFEYLSDISIRPKQIRLIKNICAGKIDNIETREFIAQLIMGGGKSKVILPLLSLLLANGDKLVVLCIPREQIGVQKEYLNNLSCGSYDVKAHTLSVERNTKIDERFVEKTLHLLEKSRTSGEYLVITPETLEALELKWHELRRNGDLNKNDQMRINLGKIFSTLGEKGLIVLDEADRCLDIRKELNFTEGAPKPLEPHLCEQFTEIYDCLLQFNDTLNLLQNQQSAEIEQQWPIIKEKIALELATNFCKGKMECEPKELVPFLLEPKSPPPEFVKSLSPPNKERLGLIRAQLTVFLPLTLSKTGLKDYAYSKEDPSLKSAIPAELCVPREKSRFGTPYEAVNYTLQLILQQGMTRGMLQKVVSDVQSEASLLVEKGRSYEDSPLLTVFQKVLPKKLLTSDFSEVDYDLLAENLKKSPKIALELAKLCILPEITTYPFKSSQNSHTFVGLVAQVFGFTGTPWNWGCWPTRLGLPDLDKGTDGLTIDLLLTKNQSGDGIIQVGELPIYKKEDPTSLDKMVSSLLGPFEKKGKPLRAIIDLGAQFKGISNEEIAKSIFTHCEQQGKIKGVVFFKKDEMFVRLKDGSEIPYATCDLEPEELFTLYDNSHIIGADIPQEATAQAVVTIGENLLQKDLLQGVWRMRGLDKQQTCSFFVPQSVAKTIFPSQEDVTMESILSFAAINQAKRQKDDTLRAAKREIPSIIRNAVVRQLARLEAEGKFAEASELFNAFDEIDGIFRSNQTFSPWHDFGSAVKKNRVSTVLGTHQKNWIVKLSNLKLPTGENSKFVSGLSEKVTGWKPSHIERMPAKVEENALPVTDTSVEVQTQVNTQAQLNMQKELNEESFLGFSDEPPKTIYTLEPQGYPLSKRIQEKSPLSLVSEFYKEVPIFVTPNQVTNAFGKKCSFLESPRKPIEHVLVKETGDLQNPLEFYLIDLHDLEACKKELCKGKKEKIWVYTLANKDFGMKTPAANPQQWLEQPVFIKNMVKIQLIAGFANLTPEEEKAFILFIKEMGLEEFQKLFEAVHAGKITKREKFLVADLIKKAGFQGSFSL